jgi:hypothetical protein
MKAVVTLVNEAKGLIATQTDQGFCVIKLLDDYDIDPGDILEGGFGQPGQETVKNISQIEDIHVDILEVGLTPFTVERRIKQA